MMAAAAAAAAAAVAAAIGQEPHLLRKNWGQVKWIVTINGDWRQQRQQQ
jgi:predicted NAD-dependent protein-ADP-ribosyltransferase YbiA (DUF1768 family)